MSHTTTIAKILLTDMQAFKAACAELKRKGVDLDIVENAKPRAYYDNQMGKAPYVVRLNNSRYDVGVYPTKDGKAHECRADFFGGDIQGQLGGTAKTPDEREQAPLGKLYQMYAVHAATRQAVRKGYTVNRVEQDDGTIQLQVAA